MENEKNRAVTHYCERARSHRNMQAVFPREGSHYVRSQVVWYRHSCVGIIPVVSSLMAIGLCVPMMIPVLHNNSEDAPSRSFLLRVVAPIIIRVPHDVVLAIDAAVVVYI